MEQENKLSEKRFNELKGYATNSDKDYRFMMSNEFADAIEKDQITNVDWKKSIVSLIQAQLSDKEAEVQQNALRNIGRLVKKIEGTQIKDLSNNVMSLLKDIPENTQNQNQDMFSNCLKQIIKEVPDTLISQLLDLVSEVNVVLKQRFDQLDQKKGLKEERIKILRQNLEQVLEVGIELFKRQIGITDPKRLEISTTLLSILNKFFEPVIQKKASLLLSEIMLNLPVKDVDKNISIEQILQTLFKSINLKDEKQYLIQIGSYSNLIVRVSNKLDKNQLQFNWDKFQEHINLFLDKGKKLEEDFDDEKVEYVTSVLEKLSEIVASLVQGNPQGTKDFNKAILSIAINLLSFSPGINLEFQDEFKNQSIEEEDENEEEEESDNDDDSTWRVRKQALKIMRNLIRFHPDRITDFFRQVMLNSENQVYFIERIQEKNQGVRQEVIKCIESIIKTITIEDTNEKSHENIEDDDFLSSTVNCALKRLNSQMSDIPFNQFLTKLLGQIKILITLKRYSQSIKQETLVFFKSICWNLNKKILEDPSHWSGCFSIIEYLLTSSNLNNDIKYECLFCIKNLFKRREIGNAAHINLKIGQILDYGVKNMDDKFFKIQSESIKVISHLLRFLNINNKDSLSRFVEQYKKIVERVIQNLKKNDLDISVKQSLFQLCSSLLENVLSELSLDQINEILTQVSLRIESENKIQSLIKIFQRLPENKFKEKMEQSSANVISSIQQKLIKFLSKNDRPLKLIVLQASKKLWALLSIKPSFFNHDLSEQFISESLYLLQEQDIYLAGITLEIYQLIFKFNTKSPNKNSVIDKIILLSKSQNLQVQGTKEANNLFELLKVLSTQTDVINLINNFSNKVDPNSIQSFSQAISTLIQTLPTEAQNQQINQFSLIAFDTNKQEVNRQLALYVLCEYGKNVDISNNSKIVNGVASLIQSPTENRDQIKIHAAKCYGGIASKNIETFIGNIKQQISSSKEGYLTLYTLKEALQNTKKFSNQILEIEEYLFTSSSQQDESLRNIVSECIGISYKIDYNNQIKSSIIKHLQMQGIQNENIRLVTAQSFKYFCNKGIESKLVQDTIDALISPSLLTDTPNIRTAVFKSLSMIAHNIPQSITKKLTRNEFYVNLQKSLKIDFSLIKEVDLGAFKNKIDDGENQRSSAFTLLENLLAIVEKNEIQECIDLIIPDILTEIEIEMNEDIQIIRLTILNRISKNYTEKIINHLGYLQENLFKFLNKLKITKGERALKVLDQCVKSFMILHNVAFEEQKTDFVTFYTQNILAVEQFKKIVERYSTNLY